VFRSSGFYQQALASIRYAQKLAIASGCDVEVSIAAGGCTVSWDANCGAANGTPVANPASGLNDFCASSSAAAVSGDTIVFDHIGRPDAAGAIIIDGRQIAVESETGYAHEP
jgi:MSHA pilin protein MshC